MRTLMNNTLPDGWRESSIFKEAPLQRGFDLPAHSVINGPYPVIGSNGIIFHHNAYMCEGPGLITGRSGTIGKFTFIPKGQYWPHNTSLWVTNFYGNDPKFVYYLYHTLALENYLSGSGVPTLNRNLIHNIAIQIPPLSEQTRIASALTSIDNLISSLDKLIEKKKAIKKGTMQQLLTGKKRLKGFNDPWVEKELGKIGDTYSGLTGKTKDDFGVGNAHYITFLNILNNPVLDTSIFEKVRVVENEKQNDALKGDLFFNTSSETPEEVGICSMLDDDIPSLYLNSFCFGYRLSDKQISPKYLVYYFRCSKGRKLMTLLAQGVTRYNMSKTAFNTAKIVIPSCLDEQIKIVHILTSMDLEIQSLEAKRNKYIMAKQGMMQQLLTGKIRLV